MADILLKEDGDHLLQEIGDALLVIENAIVFDDFRQDVIDGIVSAQSEATGWNALRSSIPVTAVVRTSDTVITVTIPALPTYDITAQEVITVTVPASVLVGAAPIVATPTMTINPVLPPPHIDRRDGSQRPFPFLPSTAQRR